jgi:hypothetical protein
MSADWNITDMTSLKDGNGDPEFIIDVAWEATYTHPTYVDGDGNPLTARAYGTAGFDDQHASRQVPWNNINENQVIAWVKAEINKTSREGENVVAAIESGLIANTEKRGNPPTVKGKPW